MDDGEWLVEPFEANRARLRAVAYRMLGSLSDADDAVQEVWLRVSRSDTRDVANLAGWLTTVVSRICLDMLRSRGSRREDLVGAHLPEQAGGQERLLRGPDPRRRSWPIPSVSPCSSCSRR